MIIQRETYLKVVKEGSAIPWPVNTKGKKKTKKPPQTQQQQKNRES